MKKIRFDINFCNIRSATKSRKYFKVVYLFVILSYVHDLERDFLVTCLHCLYKSTFCEKLKQGTNP